VVVWVAKGGPGKINTRPPITNNTATSPPQPSVSCISPTPPSNQNGGCWGGGVVAWVAKGGPGKINTQPPNTNNIATSAHNNLIAEQTATQSEKPHNSSSKHSSQHITCGHARTLGWGGGSGSLFLRIRILNYFHACFS